jgi:hypothetical protein
LRYFVRGFLDVRFDRQVELVRVHDDLFERGVADRVRRVGSQRERQPRLVLAFVAHGEARLQIAVCVGRITGRREIEDHEAEHRAPFPSREMRGALASGEKIPCRC